MSALISPASGEGEGGSQHLYTQLSIQPFEQAVAKFLSKYQHTRDQASQLSRAGMQSSGGGSGAGWEDPATLRAFFGVRDQFNQIFADSQRAQGQIMDRVSMLGKVLEQQGCMFDEVEAEIERLLVQNDAIKRSVAAHTELQLVLSEQLGVLLEMKTSQHSLSNAERAFQSELMVRAKGMTRYASQLQELKLKTGKLVQMQQQIDGHQKVYLKSRKTLSDTQAQRIQPVIHNHHRAISECVQNVEALSQEMQRMEVSPQRSGL